MRNAQLTIARLERSFNGGLNLPMIHSTIRSGMLRIRNRMTNNAVIIKRIIKLSILQAQMRRLPSLFPVYLCRWKKARRAYRCSAREPQFTRAIRKTHLRCFPLLRSSFLLMKWRSLRAFLVADFPASTKSATRKARVNCYDILLTSYSYI